MYSNNIDNDVNNINEDEGGKTISTATSNKIRSFVWEHFNRNTDGNGVSWAKCKYCL